MLPICPQGIDAASYMSETDLAAYLGSRPRLTKVVSVDLVEAVNGSEIRASLKTTTTWLDGAKIYGKSWGFQLPNLSTGELIPDLLVASSKYLAPKVSTGSMKKY